MERFQYIFNIAVASAMAMLAVSCFKDDLSDDAEDTFSYTIEAVADGGTDTKTTLGSETSRQVFWTEKDEVGVYQVADNGSTTNVVFTATEGGSTRTKLTYSGASSLDESKPVYAIYPSTGTSFDGTAFTATVAADQTAATSGTFSDGVNVAVAYASSIKTDLNFRNAVSYLKVGFTNVDSDKAPISKITVETLDGSALAGTLKITPSTTGRDPTIEVSNGTPSVSLSSADGKALSPDVYYYIAVIPGAAISAKGYKVSFSTASGLTFSREYTSDNTPSLSSGVTIKRNQISKVGKKNLNNFTVGVEGYWRVTDTYPERSSESDLPAGDYLLVKNTTASSTGYRIFDDTKTDVYISGGWALVDKFSYKGASDVYKRYEAASVLDKLLLGAQLAGILSPLKSDVNSWEGSSSAPTFISQYVLYSFRNAYSDNGLEFNKSYVDELIKNPSDLYKIAITDDATLGKVITIKLCYKSGGAKSVDTQLTGCTLTLDSDNAYWIEGNITEQSVKDFVGVLYIGKGGKFTSSLPQSDTESAALKAVNYTTRLGFCETQQTTVDGTVLNNCFMIKNYKLCNTPDPVSIWLYKKGTKDVKYEEYISKLFL